MVTLIKETPEVHLDYEPATRAYRIGFRMGDKMLTWKVSDEMVANLSEAYVENQDKVQEAVEARLKAEKRADEIAEQMNSTINTIKNKFEEQLNDERRLRTEAEERNEHLQYEVSKLRGELQRRNESNSGYASKTIYTEDQFYTLVNDKPPSPPVRYLPGDSTGATLPPGWPYTSSSGGTALDDPLQLLREWDHPRLNVRDNGSGKGGGTDNATRRGDRV